MPLACAEAPGHTHLAWHAPLPCACPCATRGGGRARLAGLPLLFARGGEAGEAAAAAAPAPSSAGDRAAQSIASATTAPRRQPQRECV